MIILTRFYISLFFIVWAFGISYGQSDKVFTNKDNSLRRNVPSTDTVSVQVQDTIKLPKGSRADTLNIVEDTLPKNNNLGYRLSKDKITEPIDYSAQDSNWIDLNTNTIYLYGNAKVKYQPYTISAHKISLNTKLKFIEGFDSGIPGEQTLGEPLFTDGQNNVNYKHIKFNYDTKKGIVDYAKTKQADFFINASKSKFISTAQDSTQEENIIYQKNAIITTCDHYPPHFGIRAYKLKTIPDKLGVLSMANLEIAGVPTPAIIPFAFFPLVKGKSSGLILPFPEFNAQLGFGFREFGYYFPVNENMDMRLTADIYTRGTFSLRSNINYNFIYKYTGNLTLGFTNTKQEDINTGERISNLAFSINFRHAQHPKAHPFRRFAGSVNVQTNLYEQRTFQNSVAPLVGAYSSNLSFTHDMPGTPFRFSADFRHSQSTQSRTMDITLPNVTLRMNTITPFKRKNVTQLSWVDNIAVSYNSEFRNFVKTTDSTLFTQQTLKDLQTGIAHKGQLSTNFRALGYLNVSPSINYEEYWFLKKYQETFDPTLTIDFDTIDTPEGQFIQSDTLQYGRVNQGFINDFTTYRSLNTSISVNTQIFGIYQRTKGWFRGFRHVMKPTISFVYRPENMERYMDIVQTDTRPDVINTRMYNILTNSPFGTLRGSEEVMGLSYSLNNIFEAKYFSKKDSTAKLIKLFNNINIVGNYNFAADSFQWSDININGNTTIFKGLTNFVFNASYSPYVHDINGRKTRLSVWDDRKALLEFRTFNGQFSTGITIASIRDILSGGKTSGARSSVDKENKLSQDKSIFDLLNEIRIAHSYNFQFSKRNGRDTFIVSNHSIGISGRLPLTQNWNISIGNIGYDLKNNALVFPQVSFSRDLHCWQMNFTWTPVGGVYSFFIGVKSNQFSFIKYEYGQQNAGTLFNGRR